jgi:PAS domain S-box-containing protein
MARILPRAAGRGQVAAQAVREGVDRDRVGERRLCHDLPEGEVNVDAETAEVLRAANLALTESLELEVVLERLLDCLGRLVPFDSANVMLLEDDARMVVHATRGYERWPALGIRGLRFELSAYSIFRDLVATRGSLLVADTSADPRWRLDYGAPHVRNWLGVPLVAAGRVIGLYSLDKAEASFFGEEHLRLTEALAPQAVIAIQNARLFEQLQRHAAELENRALERAQTEQALQHSEEQTRAILEAAYDAFVSVDAHGRITAWNAQAEASFGWSRSEAVGRLLSETIIPPQHREAHRKGLARFMATGEGPVLNRLLELTALHRSGREFPVELKISAHRSGSERIFTAFAHDISQRKELEQTRDSLVHTMVHDLRSPLTSIAGALELLALFLGPEHPHRHLVETAQRGGGKLLRLINSILEVSRLEQGALPLMRQSVGLASLVPEVLSLQAPLADEKGLHLVSQLPASLPPAWADWDLVTRVVQNLIDNAIKFTPRGGEIRIVAIHVESELPALQVTVSDTGPGIPAELSGRLFAKFATAPGEGRGSGLGLAFCKLAVEAHGGRIWVDSQPSRGSSFHFTLPVFRAGRPGE